MKQSRIASFTTAGIKVLLIAVGAGPLLPAEDINTANVFGDAEIEQVYRVRLDRGDLLLESLQAVIKKHDIRDGALLTAVGSVQDCTFHWVTSLAETPEIESKTLKEPMEILNINGIIADGEPHFHMTLSNADGAFGGHLDPGCHVLYRAEFTVAKFSGTQLARKPGRGGVPVLQKK